MFMEDLNPKDISEDEVNMMWNTMLSNIPANQEGFDTQLSQIVARSLVRLAPATVKNFQNEAQ